MDVIAFNADGNVIKKHVLLLIEQIDLGNIPKSAHHMKRLNKSIRVITKSFRDFEMVNDMSIIDFIDIIVDDIIEYVKIVIQMSVVLEGNPMSVVLERNPIQAAFEGLTETKRLLQRRKRHLSISLLT